jgi:hypothetical protein
MVLKRDIHREYGFGLNSIKCDEFPSDIGIYAKPDIELQEIVVSMKNLPIPGIATNRIEELRIATYIPQPSVPEDWKYNPEEHLREVIIDFLAKICLAKEVLTW